MGIFGNPRTGDHLVDDALHFRFRQIVHLIAGNAEMIKRFVRNQIDLIHQNPFFDLIMIPVEQHFPVFLEKADRLF